MAARLTIHFGDRPAKAHLARQPGEYLVGRDPACDFVLDDPRVSRRHAKLEIGDDGGVIEDLGSKNGVAVDGLGVERAVLPADAWLTLGGLAVHFESGTPEALEASAERERRRGTLAEHRALAEPGLAVAALVERLLASFLEMSGTDRGCVLLGSERRFEVMASRGLSADAARGEEFSGSASAVRRALAAGTPVVASDAGEAPPAGTGASIVRESIRALVCLPLVSAGQALGAIYADSRRPGKDFSELDLEILTALAAHAAMAMTAAGLQQDLAALARGLPTHADGATPGLAPLPGYPVWSIAPESGREAGT